MSGVILIVDDSATIRASVKNTLDQAGYEVYQAMNGQAGLESLKQLNGQGKTVSMIISDVNMPVMDGITFIRELKKNLSYKFTPVLVLTTESQDSKKIEGKEAGAAGWLVKPFEPDTLVGVVRKFVR
ncbi:MAG: response regulator [Nitrospirota bacterium]|nr:response regulator [Nitrospirota bacterium]